LIDYNKSLVGKNIICKVPQEPAVKAPTPKNHQKDKRQKNHIRSRIKNTYDAKKGKKWQTVNRPRSLSVKTALDILDLLFARF